MLVYPLENKYCLT